MIAFSTRRPRVLAAVALAATLTLAACGSNSGGKADPAKTFKTSYRAESVKLKAIGDELGTSIGAASSMTDAQVAQTFGGLAKRAHMAADSLKNLVPTDAAKPALTTLENAVEKAAGDLDTITAAARTQNPDAAKTAAAALVADSEPIAASRKSLDAILSK
jgi:hypothetical protein